MFYWKKKYQALVTQVTKEDCKNAEQFVKIAIEAANKSNISFDIIYNSMIQAVRFSQKPKPVQFHNIENDKNL